MLSSAEKLILSTVLQDHPEMKEDEIVLSLVNIKNGSVDLEFQTPVPALVIPAFERAALAIRESNFKELPFIAIDAIKKMVSYSRSRQCSIDFYEQNGTENILATITPETMLETIPTLLGETILYGELIRVGGINPAVLLRMADGRTVICHTDRATARNLASRLYTWIGLKGTAEYIVNNFEMVDFAIKEITEFEDKPVIQVINDLAVLVGPYYKEIDDVMKYISEMRGEYPEMG
jgi:hypothetical protein